MTPAAERAAKERRDRESRESRHGNRFHNPPVELPSSNAQDFYEESKITHAEESELRRKFLKFCTKIPPPADGGDDDCGQSYLSLDNFCRLLQYYECANGSHYEAYFHAIDRNRDEKLDFQEFYLGCCAADPATVHILNSFTGFERSQYIFDFYDTNRNATLEFDEFAKLIADCLSMHITDPTNDLVKTTALEKARDLGVLEEFPCGAQNFTCIKFDKFYEYIQNERLRGTSRLFRFCKSIIKSRGNHASRRQAHLRESSERDRDRDCDVDRHGSERHDGHERRDRGERGERSEGRRPGDETVGGVDDIPSDKEDFEWHALLLELDKDFDPDGSEQPGVIFPPAEEVAKPASYTALLPPAPAPSPSFRLENDTPGIKDVARKVLKQLVDPCYEGLLPGGPGAATECKKAPLFTLMTPAQLRGLCVSAIKSLETEDMVVVGLQPPVKIFGGLHGQLMDLLSHFKWHQPPVDPAPKESGDILYTKYVFLGDYADRGMYCLEVLTLVLCLKVVHPNRVALLRGHHENRHLNYYLGLKAECERRLGSTEGLKVYEHFNRVFEYMSLAAIIGQQILALGPGVLPPSLTKLEQLRRYKKPLVLPHATQPRSGHPVDRLNEQVLLELFTPGHLLGRGESAPRINTEVTKNQVKTFCAAHRLASIVRSRQIPLKGYAFEFGGQFITINSCLNYLDAQAGNDASILCITKEEGSLNMQVRPKVLTSRIGKVYQVLGRSFRCGEPPSQSRWPTQVREATPGRIGSSSRRNVDQASTVDEMETISDAAALVVYADRNISNVGTSVETFPAYGPGRPPGGLIPSREGLRSGARHFTESSFIGTRNDSKPTTPGATPSATTPGGSTVNERRSLGSRRSSGAGQKGAQDAAQESRRSQLAKNLDPILTSMQDTEDEVGEPTPNGMSPERKVIHRGAPSNCNSPTSASAPGSGLAGAAAAATGGELSRSVGATQATTPMSAKPPSGAGLLGGGGSSQAGGGGSGVGPTEATPGGHRRGGSSAAAASSPDQARLSLGGSGGQAGLTPPPAALGSTSERRDSKPGSAVGSSTPTGRSTPASGGVLAAGRRARAATPSAARRATSYGALRK